MSEQSDTQPKGEANASDTTDKEFQYLKKPVRTVRARYCQRFTQMSRAYHRQAEDGVAPGCDAGE